MDDDLRQPLKRRSFLSRLFAARPTALRAATVSCIAALAGVGVWAVATHEPYGGQPVVHMQIDTSDPIVTSSLNKPEPQEQDPSETGNQTGGDTAGNGQLDSDGGTEVIDLTHLASRQARRDGETDFERLQRQLAQKNRVRDEAEVESPADAISIDQLPTSRDQAVAPPRSAISLVPAPVSRITGKGPHGALPVVAKDGSKAAKLYARPVPAEQLLSDMPKVALLIGGMGLNAELTRATVEALPPEISLAFAPYGENLQQQANAARARGHEVFLQLPMEPFGYPSIDPGPRTLLTLHRHNKTSTACTGTSAGSAVMPASPTILAPSLPPTRKPSAPSCTSWASAVSSMWMTAARGCRGRPVLPASSVCRPVRPPSRWTAIRPKPWPPRCKGWKLLPARTVLPSAPALACRQQSRSLNSGTARSVASSCNWCP
jgi:hypothetical protein